MPHRPENPEIPGIQKKVEVSKIVTTPGIKNSRNSGAWGRNSRNRFPYRNYKFNVIPGITLSKVKHSGSGEPAGCRVRAGPFTLPVSKPTVTPNGASSVFKVAACWEARISVGAMSAV